MYFSTDNAEQLNSWISAIRSNIAFNSYLKKTVMVKARVDRRVGDFVTDYQNTDVYFLFTSLLSLFSFDCMLISKNSKFGYRLYLWRKNLLLWKQLLLSNNQ